MLLCLGEVVFGFYSGDVGKIGFAEVIGTTSMSNCCFHHFLFCVVLETNIKLK